MFLGTTSYVFVKKTGTDLSSDTFYRCLDKLAAHRRAFFLFLRERSTYFESDPPFEGKRRFGHSRDRRGTACRW